MDSNEVVVMKVLIIERFPKKGKDSLREKLQALNRLWLNREERKPEMRDRRI